mmetsp:Transcript_3247/g.4747  ORF Transcript_3247/g.4747 Transcript_3247/m.4747 type:complete len:106 (-) Transcript_3247:145-462(-)
MVSFLTTRVISPDKYNYKKVGRCNRYLKETRNMPLNLEASNIECILLWVEASFIMHRDLKTHTSATIMMGKDPCFQPPLNQKSTHGFLFSAAAGTLSMTQFHQII